MDKLVIEGYKVMECRGFQQSNNDNQWYDVSWTLEKEEEVDGYKYVPEHGCCYESSIEEVAKITGLAKQDVMEFLIGGGSYVETVYLKKDGEWVNNTTPKKEFTSENVVKIIFNEETNPLCRNEAKIRRGLDYIQTLSRRSQKRLHRKINKALNAYYTQDETGNSPYDYDQMYL